MDKLLPTPGGSAEHGRAAADNFRVATGGHARLYVEVAKRSFQRHLAYRAATLAGLFTNSVFGVLIASMYAGFYGSRAEGATVAGYELIEIFTFVWIGQSMIMVVYLWSWWEIATAIQTGDIVTDLMKPIDYYLFWLSRDLGRAACHAITRMSPTLLMGALLYDLALPSSPGRWLVFALSVTLAVVVSFSVRFIFNISAFWFVDVRGMHYVQYLLTTFFSGMLVPIAFFPAWLRVLSEWMPFRSIIMVPVDVALGRGNAALMLVLQGFWAVALGILAHLILRRAIRKLEVQGG
ncbi:MAG: ABC transporter permease [Thermomicrobiales bacterium]